MSAAVTAVQKMYTQATMQLPAMLHACHSDEETAGVWAEYYALRDNFDNCVNKSFQENDPELMDLEASANASAQQIARIGTQLSDITKVLGTLSDAVGWGIKIAAKVIAV